MGTISCKTKKTLIVIILLLIISMVIAPTSQAYYTDSMRKGEKYEYTGSLLTVYKNKEGAKRSNIFKIRKILRKGAVISIDEINGNIIKIGNGQYIKFNSLNSNKFKKLSYTSTEAPSRPPELPKPEIPSITNVTGIELNPKEAIIYMENGGTYQLSATVKPNNATTKKIKWTSNNENIAQVDQNGKVTGKKIGKATITATTEDGMKTAKCEITVTQLSLNYKNLSLNAKESTYLKVKLEGTNKYIDNSKVTYKTSNKNVATVDKSGKITGIAKGTATITAVAENGITLTCKVTVTKIAVNGVKLNKSSLNLNMGNSETLTVTVSPSNATNKSVTWKSNNEKVATVNSKGKITPKGTGKATITVTSNDGSNKTAKCTVTVKRIATSIVLDDNELDLNIGDSKTLKATIEPSDTTNKSVTWKSSNKKVATVNSEGKVTAKGLGEATITVTTKDGSGKTAKCTVTVKKPFVDVAAEVKQKVAKYYKKGKIRYSQGTFDFSQKTPFTSGTIDCSSFVSLVIYKYGKTNNIDKYEKAFVKSKSTSTMIDYFNSESGKKLFKKIGRLDNVGKKGNLKAGDILLRDGRIYGGGHAEIYGSTHKDTNKVVYDCYNCGANNALKYSEPHYGGNYNNESKYIVYRLIK